MSQKSSKGGRFIFGLENEQLFTMLLIFGNSPLYNLFTKESSLRGRFDKFGEVSDPFWEEKEDPRR